MRKLLNTLFVLSEDAYLSLENQNVLIHKDDKEVRIPLLNLENIIYFGYKGVSPALLGACAKEHIGFCFMTPNGKFLARVCGLSYGNVLLRKLQYRWADSEGKSCLLSRYIITGKISNERSTLMRTLRDHSFSVDVDSFQKVITLLHHLAKEAFQAPSLEELRGIEGHAAHLYFSLFNEMILADKNTFHMENRNRRPPLDPMNALLSFLYTLLAHDCASALEAVGLDSYVGFMHQDRPGRQSLALDLMEEFRSIYVDRLAVTLVNQREITKQNFKRTESGAVLLNNKGKETVLQAWQKKKQGIIRHPFIQEKIPWGLVPYVQALLMAKFIRGDLEGYPAFVWK